jgi:pimeloyl-ACP methyl ester carboxylesterase
MAERCFERGLSPRGTARQLMAITSARDRTADLASVGVPTTVIHGTADRLVMPSGGRATATAIPNARLVEIEGMGHDVPPVLWDQIVAEIAATAERAAVRL